MKSSKKSSLALAVLTALCGTAIAQQSSLTVYGLIDASVRVQNTRFDKPGPAAGGRVHSVEGGGGFSSSGSRLGFRGVEDLGAGWNAHFVLEHGLRVDTGGAADPNSFFNRQAAVGLTTPWGTVDLGRQYSVAFKSAVEFDPFVGQYANLNLSVGGVPGSVAPGCLPMMAGACVRFNNNVQYTGSFERLTVRAEVSPGEATAGTSAALGAKYDLGGLSVGVSLTRQEMPFVAPGPTLPGYPGTPAGAEKEHLFVGASYAFSGLRVMAGVSRDSTETNVADTVFETSWAGLNWRLNPAVQLTGAFYQSQLTSAVSALRPQAQEKVEVLLLEARYALSRRSSVYAEVDRSNWSRGVNFLPTQQPGAVLTGLSVGVTHRF
jgi:predicted porin